MLHKVGARRWIARIMITWALVAGAMAFVKGANRLLHDCGFCWVWRRQGFSRSYLLSDLLGAGSRRARLVGTFMTAIPIRLRWAVPYRA